MPSLFPKKQKLPQIISYTSCTIILLESNQLESHQKTRDFILATCMQKNLLDMQKTYSLVWYETPKDQLLVVAVPQDSIFHTSIPEFFLPLALDQKYTNNTLFCFKNFLVALYQQKIILLQKNENPSDLLLAIETIKNFTKESVQTIYTDQKYESIPIHQESLSTLLGTNYYQDACLQCLKLYPSLFLQAKPRFYQQSLFYLFCFLTTLFIVLNFGVTILQYSIDKLQKTIASLGQNIYPYHHNTKNPAIYFSKYNFIHHLNKEAAHSLVHFESFTLLTQEKDFFMLLNSCHANKDHIKTWNKNLENYLLLFYPNVKNITTQDYQTSPYHCTETSWQNQ
ncbi:hypothetical protein LW135_05015 [Helicobacter sp. faydin-H20]|uniref:hypothetical protein n=1 Tax=Helicobacter anatolicus TaxID=2905874 RepID=UPI001E476E5F|nr:hypothetical protein [Helicobacter anatolicus]MCE3037188.1 hypothetical protein [Helicobacter anatolicus]